MCQDGRATLGPAAPSAPNVAKHSLGSEQVQVRRIQKKLEVFYKRCDVQTIRLASAAGDINTEHDIYDDDAVCDYPQSGERILGRSNLQALRGHHPGKPSGFNVRRIVGEGDLWVNGIHDHLPEATGIHRQHHGVPQR